MLDRVSVSESAGLSGVPFTAPAYFTGLRVAGAEPYCTATHITHGIGEEVDQVAAEKLHAWARNADPDRKLQKEYARQIWSSGPLGVLAVQLG